MPKSTKQRTQYTVNSKAASYLREKGYVPHKTEWWNPYARQYVDMFGFADFIGLPLKDKTRPLAVQATTKHNMSNRLTKIGNNPLAILWLKFGDIVVLGLDDDGDMVERFVTADDIEYEVKTESESKAEQTTQQPITNHKEE